ncbi:unnamed protein product [Moneuplotes crassus]|uniref:Uncharacterized protein n=1 Tax=Euplotes crassus TaxID=5936 RepID=A0AAD1XU60_EUPCR|nr:unnamed protein product [Moneuplotes crassus]
MARLEGKICLVTGGTAGIGLGIAERFAKEGAKVIICSRKGKGKEIDEKLESDTDKFSDLDIEIHACNVGKAEERKAFIEKIGEKYGRIDVLVLNVASSTHFGMQLDITEKAFDKMFELNVKSTFFTIKEAKPYLEMAENPNILVISSLVGTNPSPPIGVYSMTKAALDNMVKFLAIELRSDNIRINGLAPGLIKTYFAKNIWDNPEIDQDRVGLPSDIGSVAATLCSDDGNFCNGAVFQVNGGFSSM